MQHTNRVFNLSIFTRALIMMLIALAVAESIAIVLIIKRPPIHNRPVTLVEIAREFKQENQSAEGPSAQKSHSSAMESAEPPPRPSSNLPRHTAAQPPQKPDSIDEKRSETIRQRLAGMLGISVDELRVYLAKNDGLLSGPPPFDDNELTQGFLIAKQQGDGNWLIIKDVVQPFPNEFHKQGLMLFGIGAIILLPLAWLFSLSLARPIEKFSQAAKRLGANPNVPPLAVEGPREMLLAIESFNNMQERLNSLLRERTDMIAAIAHDLRTPLTRLAFRLDDLPSPLNEKVSADIQEMKSMISLALDFISDRSKTLQRERLDFRLLVESVVDDHCDTGQDVSLETGASITIEGDPLGLRRAVMNLVDNAIKYGTTARLRLDTTEEFCVLTIEDDGPGIDETLHKRVFEPFFRVETSRNRDTGGVGLGLSLVRAIIQEHGGDISLANIKPAGLRVTIKLPLHHSRI